MGKIQITESQYNKLKKTLIRTSIEKNLISEATLDEKNLTLTLNKKIEGSKFVIAAPSIWKQTPGGKELVSWANIVDKNTYDKKPQAVYLDCDDLSIYLGGDKNNRQTDGVTDDSDFIGQIEEFCNMKVGDESAAKIQSKAMNCGWGLDWQGYQNSGFVCYTPEQIATAKKCGHTIGETRYGISKDTGDYAKYQASNWACGAKQEGDPQWLRNLKQNAWKCGWGDDYEEYKNQKYACPKPGTCNGKKWDAFDTEWDDGKTIFVGKTPPPYSPGQFIMISGLKTNTSYNKSAKVDAINGNKVFTSIQYGKDVKANTEIAKIVGCIREGENPKKQSNSTNQNRTNNLNTKTKSKTSSFNSLDYL